ncbi:MAG: nucleoside deaminase [Pyrinomonadaceae bacterium]
MNPYERRHIETAIDLALEAERGGNLPIGAVIAIGEDAIAAGANSMLSPQYDPGRHAEIEALRNVPAELWPRTAEMTCYTTLEPCVMCFGTLLLHGVGRIVFGAVDRQGGASPVLAHLPPYYLGDSAAGRVPEWIGPVAPAECGPLYERAAKLFDGTLAAIMRGDK